MAEGQIITPPIQGQLPAGWQLYAPLITSLARDMLNVLGTAGVVWAQSVSGSQLETYVGVGMVLASIAWGKLQKLKAMRALDKAAASPPIKTPTLPA